MNATTETELLKMMTDIDNIDVRIAAAESEHATERVLLEALLDKKTPVNWAAAANPRATELVLKIAMLDPYWGTHKEAVCNPSATEAVLLAALDDQVQEVRLAAIAHPAATVNVLLKALELPHETLEAGLRLARGIRLISGTIKSAPWEFEAQKYGDCYAYRRGREHIEITRDQLRRAYVERTFHGPAARPEGKPRLFLAEYV